MSYAELERAIKAIGKIKQQEQKDRASFDYILAEAIGRSIARIYSKAAEYPAIEVLYPTLFNGEEIAEKKQEQLDNVSSIRFRQFANTFNAKLTEVDKNT